MLGQKPHLTEFCWLLPPPTALCTLVQFIPELFDFFSYFKRLFGKKSETSRCFFCVPWIEFNVELDGREGQCALWQVYKCSNYFRFCFAGKDTCVNYVCGVGPLRKPPLTRAWVRQLCRVEKILRLVHVGCRSGATSAAVIIAESKVNRPLNLKPT